MGEEGKTAAAQSTIYLTQVRQRYARLRTAIDGLQAKAAEESRDLSTEELRSIHEMGEQGKGLQAQIKSLTDVALRDAQVSAMKSQLDLAVFDAQQTAGKVGGGEVELRGKAGGQPLGGATTQDRDPGIYTLGGQYSFVADQFRSAQMNDEAARERLTRHTNAIRSNPTHLRDVLGTTVGGGVGLVPPVWLAVQFAPILHRRLRVAAQLRQVPWSGPFPWTIPIATTPATGTTVAEGTNPTETDPVYTTVTVLPQTVSGFSEVSRQLLEGSNPSVDAIIWGDLVGNFYDNAESITIAALEAQTAVNLQTCTGTTIDLMRNVI